MICRSFSKDSSSATIKASSSMRDPARAFLAPFGRATENPLMGVSA